MVQVFSQPSPIIMPYRFHTAGKKVEFLIKNSRREIARKKKLRVNFNFQGHFTARKEVQISLKDIVSLSFAFNEERVVDLKLNEWSGKVTMRRCWEMYIYFMRWIMRSQSGDMRAKDHNLSLRQSMRECVCVCDASKSHLMGSLNNKSTAVR